MNFPIQRRLNKLTTLFIQQHVATERLGSLGWKKHTVGAAAFCGGIRCFFSSKTMNHQTHQESTLDIMRSLLYIPGNSEKMLNKIHSMKERPDVFVPDLEDSVPYHQKEEARKMVRDFLLSTFTPDLVSEYRMHIIPRVNIEWEFLESDCEAVAIPGVVTAINVGKTSSIADVFNIDQLLTRIENKLNVPQYTFRVIPSIESAIGLVHAYQICSCLPQRTIGVAFGGDDYAHDMGFTRDTTQIVEKELAFARSTVAVSTSVTQFSHKNFVKFSTNSNCCICK